MDAVFHDLGGRNALVTGATGGLGTVISGTFARQGIHQAACYHQNREKAELMAQEIKECHHLNFVPIQLDVRDPGSCTRCVEKAISALGKIDILVNCAGVPDTPELLEDNSIEKIRNILDVNLTGTIYMIREVLPRMKEQKSGSIVVIGSIVGQKGSRGGVAYASAKSGLRGLVKTLVPECSIYGVRVNMVSPGYMDAGMMSTASPQIRAKLIKEIPLRRFGTAEDVSRFIAYLCSEACGYITGQDLSINGGAYMQ